MGFLDAFPLTTGLDEINLNCSVSDYARERYSRETGPVLPPLTLLLLPLLLLLLLLGNIVFGTKYRTETRGEIPGFGVQGGL